MRRRSGTWGGCSRASPWSARRPQNKCPSNHDCAASAIRDGVESKYRLLRLVVSPAPSPLPPSPSLPSVAVRRGVCPPSFGGSVCPPFHWGVASFGAGWGLGSVSVGGPAPFGRAPPPKVAFAPLPAPLSACVGGCRFYWACVSVLLRRLGLFCLPWVGRLFCAAPPPRGQSCVWYCSAAA